MSDTFFIPSLCARCSFDRESHDLDGDSPVLVCPQWFQTFTGVRFFPTAPRAEHVNIQDIAHALAHLCRFAGHTLQHYSVAQHCVLVSQTVDREIALQGLLHDAAEAYIVDLPRPLKHSPLLAGYREIEERVERAIATRFGLPPRFDPRIKIADRVLLATERRDVVPHHGHQWHSTERVSPLPTPIVAWHAQLAREAYLERFHELTRGAAP